MYRAERLDIDTTLRAAVSEMLSVIAIALILASGGVMVRVAEVGGLTISATLGMTFTAFHSRPNPLIGVAAGAMLGVFDECVGFAVF